jgi:uncharacterized surface protein with fasciclin (FAS1) repeats
MDIMSTAAQLQGPPIQWGSEGVLVGKEEADIKGYDNFSLFCKAVEVAGLTSVLKGPGPFTVFVPVDTAFEGRMEELAANPAALAEVLKYHVVAGKVSAGSIGADLATVNGATLTYSRRFRKTFLDGAMMDPKYPADVECTNGVIHAIDSILVPGGWSPVGAEQGLRGVQ